MLPAQRRGNHSFEIVEKVVPPALQRLHIVPTKGHDFFNNKLALGSVIDARDQATDCGQVTPRENVLLDKVLALDIPVVPRLGDGDALKVSESAFFQVAVHARKIRVEVLVADVLNHFDADNLVKHDVERPDLAVVPEKDAHLLRELRVGNPALDEPLLRQTWRDGRDPTPRRLGRQNRKAAPAGADLQNVVGGLDARRGHGILQLAHLRRLERLGLRARIRSGQPQRGRVRHVRAQKGGKQVVAERVVRNGVELGGRDVVGALERGTGHGAKEADDAPAGKCALPGRILHEKLKDGGEVRGRNLTQHIALGEANVAKEERPQPEGVAVNDQDGRGLEVMCFGIAQDGNLSSMCVMYAEQPCRKRAEPAEDKCPGSVSKKRLHG